MATYLFRGRLCGMICPECPEELTDIVVRLYKTREKESIAALAVASPKDTFAVLEDDHVHGKASSLIAETRTDGDGNFAFELGDQNYAGEPFEIDIYCGTVPHRKPGRKPQQPRQFSITTLQPVWRETENGFVAIWDYCIPWRLWCFIRGLFGAWTICGQVTTCQEPRLPISGLKVLAFDVDWLQDDDLGFGITDGNGKFRIDYLSEDFQKTPLSPFFNSELIGGPDIYFRIEDMSGNTLLKEPSSRGRQADRENAGPCFCVNLCVDVSVGTDPGQDPWWTHVGDFDIIADINGGAVDNGLTNKGVGGHAAAGYGFTGSIKLKGFCPRVSAANQPMRYRFKFEHPSNPGVPVFITGSSLVTPVEVGSRLIWWDRFGTGAVWTPQSIWIAGALGDVPGGTADPTPIPLLPPNTPWGAPPPHVIVPDPVGWVEVAQPSPYPPLVSPVVGNTVILDNGFYGALVRLNTAAAVPGGDSPGNGAGQTVASPRNGANLKITFEAGPVGLAATFTQTLERIRVSNWTEVNQLNLQQFIDGSSGSCTGLTTSLDILYTTDHELMAAWSIDIVSSANPPVAHPLVSGNVPRGSFGTQSVDISNITDWPHCSYQVWLYTRPALTDGETDRSTLWRLLTFCK